MSLAEKLSTMQALCRHYVQKNQMKPNNQTKAKTVSPGGFKFGRLYRTYDARAPHLCALLAGQTPASEAPAA